MRHTVVIGGGRRRVRRSGSEVAAILERYRASGRTQRAFAEAEGVPLSTLTFWLGRRGQVERAGKAPGSRLVAVRLRAEAAPLAEPPEGFELTLPHGIEVRVPASFAEEALRRLLRACGISC
jgi:hypothetical protein